VYLADADDAVVADGYDPGVGKKPPGASWLHDDDAFAARIKQVREARELTQEAFAAELGVHQVTVARWETGTRVPRGLVRRFLELWLAEKAPKKGGHR